MSEASKGDSAVRTIPIRIGNERENLQFEGIIKIAYRRAKEASRQKIIFSSSPILNEIVYQVVGAVHEPPLRAWANIKAPLYSDKIDELVKSRYSMEVVIPAEAGIWLFETFWTPAFAGVTPEETFYRVIKIGESSER